MRTTREKGFTLTEMMITVAMIGILAAIAIPTYQDFAMKSRRSDALDALMAARLANQKHRVDNPSYTSDVSELLSYCAAEPCSSREGYYTISINAGSVSGSAFTVTATADGTPQDQDTGCTTLTLTHDGVKSPAECW